MNKRIIPLALNPMLPAHRKREDHPKFPRRVKAKNLKVERKTARNAAKKKIKIKDRNPAEIKMSLKDNPESVEGNEVVDENP